MSFDGYRAAVAAAMSTVDGVKGYPKKPATPVKGDAWPQWGGSARSEAGPMVNTWFVLVVTPQDERQASDWADAHVELFEDALHGADVGYVDQFAPVAIATGAGDLLALRITMRSV